MVRTLVLCEKPSQAANVAAALGALRPIQPGRKEDIRRVSAAGQVECRDGITVTLAQGHLLEARDPDEIDKERWGGQWRLDQLPIAPPAPLPLRPVRDERGSDRFARDRLKLIAGLLADADRVVIATDPDRAGEAIARNILDHLRWRGRTQRLWLKDATPEGVRRFWAQMEGNRNSSDDFEPFAWEERARAYEDFVNGMTASRGANLVMKPGEMPFSEKMNAGNVMSPLVALIDDRETAIRTFVPRDYFTIAADVSSGRHSVTLMHSPTPDRVWDRSTAGRIAAAAEAFKGPLSVETNEEKHEPSRPFDAASLQKRAGALFKWSPSHTMKVLEDLYDRGHVTYPRTPSRFFPEDRIKLVGPIARQLAGFEELKAGAVLVGDRPVVRMGSRYNAEKTKAHHAIMPTEVVPKPGSLSDDGRKLYLLIARNYLANHLPAAVDLKTTISFEVGAADATGKVAAAIFSTSGSVEKSAGWRIVDPPSDKERRAKLPPIQDGDEGRVTGTQVEQKRTEPPKRFKESELPKVMARLIDELDELVADPERRSRLKEALRTDNPDEPKGLGSPATSAGIIAKVLKEKFIRVDPKTMDVSPTAKGSIKVASWRAAWPAQVDPVSRAQTEHQLAQIGQAASPREARERYMAFCASAAERAARIADALRTAKPVVPPHASYERPVSAGMAQAARSLAQRKGLKVARGANYGELSKFLDAHRESDEERTRMTKSQIETMESLAKRVRHELPENWRDDTTRKDAEKQIGAMLKAAKECRNMDGTLWPATPAQAQAVMRRAEANAGRPGTPAAPELKDLTYKAASEYLDATATGQSRPGGRGRGGGPASSGGGARRSSGKSSGGGRRAGGWER